jgi:hypothetical protein
MELQLIEFDWEQNEERSSPLILHCIGVYVKALFIQYVALMSGQIQFLPEKIYEKSIKWSSKTYIVIIRACLRFRPRLHYESNVYDHTENIP